MDERKLKMYYRYTKSRYRQIPVIRLGGEYLAKMGFKIGDTLCITLEHNKIAITKDLPGETEAGSAEAQPVRDSLD